MKVCLVATVLAFSSMSYAADWSPVFAYLEVGKSGDDGKVLSKILGNLFKQNISSRTKEPLSTDAKSGQYKNIPSPYRHDMLPAKAIKNKDGVALHGTIPLKNAKLYGYPIKSLNYWYGCYECDHLGFYATFAPMSNAQYNALKQRIRFKKADEDGCVDEGRSLAHIYKDDLGVHLVIDMGC